MPYKTLHIIMITLLGIFTMGYTNAQEVIPGEIIVKGEPSEIERLISPISLRSKKAHVSFRTLSKTQNLYLYSIPEKDMAASYIEQLEKSGIRAYYNKKLSKRNTPNDERINEQWALSSIGALDAWKETIGETDFAGEKPIVAILDDGYDIGHEDLMDNVYINESEIPDNGIDDDENGYIDDYRGLYTKTKNDAHPLRSHGTSVAGIIGAKGNNNIGISGLLWNSKVLLISGITTEADILIAYEYIYTMRKLYNDSNGNKGAYIVCTNFSGGLDNAWADNHVDWCNQYDRLGDIGILSVAAATNNNVIIEDVGDMPSTCASPYLIIAHDINEIGQLSTSGRSSRYVDIAAPGRNILTLDPNNAYKNFEGTSAASPFVAGAVQLLYTVPCETFYDRVQNDPANGALIIKEALLAGSEKLNSLVTANISEGSLDIFGSFIRISALCEQERGKLKLTTVYNNGQELMIEYQTDKSEDHTLLLYNSIGKEIYKDTFKATLFGDPKITIATANLPRGIYFITLISEEERDSRGFYLH